MKIRFIPTTAHASVDYATGATLLAAPEALRLKDNAIDQLIPRVHGAVTTTLSAITDWELAPVRIVPMQIHLAADAVGGALLGAAPWIFGTARKGTRHWLPHALIGASELFMAFTTRTDTSPGTARRILGAKVVGEAAGTATRAAGKAGRRAVALAR